MTLLAKYMINLLLWKWKHKAGRYTLVKQTDNQIKEAISPEIASFILGPASLEPISL